jgi:hypothetical protein
MGNFLDDLKKSVETGEFNSEAAKKIIEIDKLADTKVNPFKQVVDRIEKTGFAESVSEEEAAAINSEYEKKMEDIKKTDLVTKEMAVLEEIEDLVKADIGDMLLHVGEVEKAFEKELTGNDAMFIRLKWKLEELKNKYQPALMEYIRKE